MVSAYVATTTVSERAEFQRLVDMEKSSFLQKFPQGSLYDGSDGGRSLLRLDILLDGFCQIIRKGDGRSLYERYCITSR